ncbi:hypothetical protein D0469_04105 [Peribacillus saganii]|uniref:DUF1440 domain-containing protein n=1 Tax=Peribacillus saganii TaxID=2303992 RepID=A0A372LSF5_9BACI|nr:hypothetical protein [Peribacillus saganii]RFU71129.1 hypothetical protein D0469_04105 [Peribacillus saganii]
MVRYFWMGGASGVLAGTVLGLIMKYVQQVTEKDIYTLLLNVDFIPFLGDQEFSETTEFVFHLSVSFLIGAGYCILISSSNTETLPGRIWLAVFITIPAILLYFPLSFLSGSPIVKSSDWLSFYFWTICHLLFAFLLAVFVRITSRFS